MGTDVIYHTRQGWAYLAVIKDLFDGSVASLSRDNSIGLVTRTLNSQTAGAKRERMLCTVIRDRYRSIHVC